MSLFTRHAKPFSSDTLRQKEVLQESVDNYRQKMDAQWQELQTNARHYGKQALVIGGVLAGVYLIMNALLSTDTEEEQAEEEEVPEPVKIVSPEQESSSGKLAVGKALKGLAWSLAIGWARQKLFHFISRR